MRNFVFGVEDSLVSTVGLLSGIAVADTDLRTIILTGVVLIFVEAFSMAVGSFLSESSAEEYLHQRKKMHALPIMASIIMFFSYFIAGFVPLSPYIVLPVTSALPLSIGFSLAALFLLGILGAKITKRNIFRGGFRMFIIGGLALLVGIIAGQLSHLVGA